MDFNCLASLNCPFKCLTDISAAFQIFPAEISLGDELGRIQRCWLPANWLWSDRFKLLDRRGECRHFLPIWIAGSFLQLYMIFYLRFLKPEATTKQLRSRWKNLDCRVMALSAVLLWHFQLHWTHLISATNRRRNRFWIFILRWFWWESTQLYENLWQMAISFCGSHFLLRVYSIRKVDWILIPKPGFLKV